MKYKNAIAVLVGCIVSAAASASLVYDATIHLTGQGFGAAPRALTIEETGRRTGTESGCVGVDSAGAIVVGPSGCNATDAVIDPNGVIPTGGDEPNTHADNQKYGIPTLGSLGITNAGQIGILFNATEPGGDSINVTDITLNFFHSTGGAYSLLTSLDGQQNFPNSFPGNGVAGFVFVVDAAEQIILNNTVFNQAGFQNIILSLNSTLTDVAAGPDSFLIFKRDGSTVIQAVPEPATLALLGIALLGGLAATRKRLSFNC